MKITPLRQAVLILCSCIALNANANNSKYYNLQIDNISYQQDELLKIEFENGSYFIQADTARDHSLKFSDSDTKTIGNTKYVNLNKIGTTREDGSNLIFHANEANIIPVKYNMNKGSVTGDNSYEDSAFINYNYSKSNFGSTLNTSLYKTFSDGVLYNFNVNYSSNGRKKLTPINLYREKYNKENLTTLRIGTSYGGQNSLTSPFSFLGIQYRKDFSLDTNYLKNPYFGMTGTAQAQSVAEIFVNDRSVGRLPVSKGTYELSNLSTGQTSANDVRVVVTDINGNVQVKSASLIGAPFNLKKGTDNFSYEGGLLRKGTTEYGPAFASGTYSYGVSDTRTVELHAEAAPGQARISANWTEASKYGTFQYGIGAGRNEFIQKFQHNYSKGNFNFNSAILKTNSYSVLGERDRKISDQKIMNFGYSFKTSNINGSFIKFDNQSRTSLTYNTNIGNSNLSLSLSKSSSSGNGISFMFSTPLDSTMTLRSTSSASYDKTGLNLSQNISNYDMDNKWTASATINKDNYANKSSLGQAQYNADNFVSTAQIQTFKDEKIITGRVEGAVVLDKGIHFTKPIYQGYAVVDTEIPNLMISHNYMNVAKTNKDGIAIVPNTLGSIDNVISIDSKSIPPEVSIDEAYFKVASKNYFKKTVKFNVKHDPVILVTSNKLEMPEVEIDGKNYIVTKSGIYFDEYKIGKEYKIASKQCNSTFKINEKMEMNQKINIECK